MGGAACAAVIIDTGNKAAAIKALCDAALSEIAKNENNESTFESRINALNSYVETCLSDAQDIAATYS